MKKNNKFEIGIIISLIILTIILFGIYLIIEIINKKNSYTLFMYPYQILECTKWKCEDNSKNISKYNSNTYKTYIEGEYKGENKVLYNDKTSKMYVFDNKNNNIFKDKTFLLAYNGYPSITQLNTTLRDLEDYDIVNKLSEISDIKLKKNQIKYINYDFDNDGKNEYLYIGNSGFIESPFFNLIVYRNDNKYYLIESKKVKTYIDNSYIIFNNLIDIFEDGKIEFTVTKQYYDQKGYCNIIYRLKGKKFVPINECEIIGSAK